MVHGLREVRVSSMEEAAALLRRGDERRTIAATDQNERSSRAHTIFRLRIVRPSSDSVLSLVDLCGSERRSAHVQGSPRDVRSGEAGSINKSLLALGQVVSKLCEAGRASVQVLLRRLHCPAYATCGPEVAHPLSAGNEPRAVPRIQDHALAPRVARR